MERASTDNWQVSLSDSALTVQDAEDIVQSIYLLIATISGSYPLRTTFGSGVYRYLDRSLQEVALRIVYEVTEAIGRWEPRIEALAVRSPARQLTAPSSPSRVPSPARRSR